MLDVCCWSVLLYVELRSFLSATLDINATGVLLGKDLLEKSRDIMLKTGKLLH